MSAKRCVDKSTDAAISFSRQNTTSLNIFIIYTRCCNVQMHAGLPGSPECTKYAWQISLNLNNKIQCLLSAASHRNWWSSFEISSIFLRYIAFTTLFFFFKQTKLYRNVQQIDPNTKDQNDFVFHNHGTVLHSASILNCIPIVSIYACGSCVKCLNNKR